MRGLPWKQPGYPRFGCNPMLLGIAVALADLYEPLLRETLPDHWTHPVATFDAGMSRR